MDPISQLKAIFVITVATARIIFPGLPAATVAQGSKEAAPVPATVSVSMDLYGSQKAGDDALASVKLPEGLKSGSSVNLQIDKNVNNAPASAQANSEDQKIVEYNYWGCGENIADGQPAVSLITTSPTPESPFPNASYAYWTNNQTQLAEGDTKAEGTYTLTTNYAGGAMVTLDSEQNNLAPINVTNLTRNFNLGKAITIKWDKIPNVKAYYVCAYGGNDNKVINWNSSVKKDIAIDPDSTAFTADQIKKYIDDKVLLPADTTSCTIPAGVFKDSMGAIATIVAIGKDTVQTKDDVETRVLVRSKADISFIRME